MWWSGYASKQRTFKQRFEGGKGAWGCLKKECHREENGQCKGPETGVCLVRSRNNKDSSEAGVKKVRMRCREEMGTKLWRAFKANAKFFVRTVIKDKKDKCHSLLS